jgi:EAL domain-containing protein (putative c-di-GMP-specific phosphodiesterase class I)
MEALQRLGCNVFQGFLLSPPVVPAELETLMRPPVQSAVA